MGSEMCIRDSYGSIWSYPPDEMVSRIKWFSKEVMPMYSSEDPGNRVAEKHLCQLYGHALN